MSLPYQIVGLNAFNDNYIWLAYNSENNRCVVVDPGDAQPVIDYLEQHQLTLEAILITHHHQDHIGGVNQLLSHVGGNISVYGPTKEAQKVVTHPLSQGLQISLATFGQSCRVLDIPGHTLGHIAYVVGDSLFCGDTLFGGGCGRMFEGTPAMFSQSLQMLSQLPAATKVFCAHEYTQSNLAFAKVVLPDCIALQQRITQVNDLRASNRPTIPSTIELELATNPFLRLTDEQAITSLRQQYRDFDESDIVGTFAAMRNWKDNF